MLIRREWTLGSKFLASGCANSRKMVQNRQANHRGDALIQPNIYAHDPPPKEKSNSIEKRGTKSLINEEEKCEISSRVFETKCKFFE
jgi:hypothetical protein